MIFRTLIALALLASFARSVSDTRTSAFAPSPRARAAATAVEERAHDKTARERVSSDGTTPEHAGRRHGERAVHVLMGLGAGAIDLCCARAVSELAGSVDLDWAGLGS